MTYENPEYQAKLLANDSLHYSRGDRKQMRKNSNMSGSNSKIGKKLRCREPSLAKIDFADEDPLLHLQMERFHTISKCIACCLSLLPQRRACASASCLCLVPQPRASALCLSLVLCTGSLRTSAPNRAVRHELKTTAQCGAALPSATRARNCGKEAPRSGENPGL